jgi:hypothetical protein
MFSRCKQSKVSGIGLLRRLSKLQAEAPTNAGASKSHRAELQTGSRFDVFRVLDPITCRSLFRWHLCFPANCPVICFDVSRVLDLITDRCAFRRCLCSPANCPGSCFDVVRALLCPPCNPPVDGNDIAAHLGSDVFRVLDPITYRCSFRWCPWETAHAGELARRLSAGNPAVRSRRVEQCAALPSSPPPPPEERSRTGRDVAGCYPPLSNSTTFCLSRLLMSFRRGPYRVECAGSLTICNYKIHACRCLPPVLQ